MKSSVWNNTLSFFENRMIFQVVSIIFVVLLSQLIFKAKGGVYGAFCRVLLQFLNRFDSNLKVNFDFSSKKKVIIGQLIYSG